MNISLPLSFSRSHLRFIGCFCTSSNVLARSLKRAGPPKKRGFETTSLTKEPLDLIALVDASSKANFLSWFKAIQQYRYTSQELYKSASRLYRCVAELVDYQSFREQLNLRDTLISSWSNITFLHMYLLFARLSQEGLDGLRVREDITEVLWKDSRQRVRQLGLMHPRSYKTGMLHMDGMYRGVMVSFDEGYLADDYVLANALWRDFFHHNLETTPKELEIMVEYVRKQLVYLDSCSSDDLCLHGLVNFVPLTESSALSKEDELRALGDIWLDRPLDWLLEKRRR